MVEGDLPASQFTAAEFNGTLREQITSVDKNRGATHLEIVAKERLPQEPFSKPPIYSISSSGDCR